VGQKPAFETLHVYQLADRLAREVWTIAVVWAYFSRDTVGKQLVRAADSIGANIAEGYGRGSHADNRRFVHIARGSLNETICWLSRAADRGLVTPEQANNLVAITDELGPKLNGYLNYINKQMNTKVTSDQQPPPEG